MYYVYVQIFTYMIISLTVTISVDVFKIYNIFKDKIMNNNKNNITKICKLIYYLSLSVICILITM